METVYVVDHDSWVVAAIFFPGVILWAICVALEALFGSVMPYIMSAWHWLIAWHFDNVLECCLHFYTWLVLAPPIVILAVGAAGVVFGILGGIGGGVKLTCMVPFEQGLPLIVGRIVIGIILVLAGLFLGILAGGFLVLVPAIFLLTCLWQCILFAKDKVFRLGWMNDVVFGVLLYALVPGGMLATLLLTGK